MRTNRAATATDARSKASPHVAAPTPSPRSELAQLLTDFVERDGRSLNRIAQASLIDVAYLWRLRAGRKANPSRDVLIRLGLALRLEPEDLDQVLVSADYAPITLRRT